MNSLMSCQCSLYQWGYVLCKRISAHSNCYLICQLGLKIRGAEVNLIFVLQVFSGNQMVNVPVDIRTIPLFYRGGYIVAKKGRPRRSSAMMIHDPYTIFVALNDSFNATASGYLYMDDFHSTDRSTARLFRMEYISSIFKFIRLEGLNHPETPFIERVVIMSPKLSRPGRVYVSTPDGKNRGVEFNFTGSDRSRSALLVIRKPVIKAEDGWEIHVE